MNSSDWEDIVEKGPVRADKWLTEKLPAYSRNQARELIHTGRVRVEGRRLKKGDRLQTGDIVTVTGLAAAHSPLPEPRKLEIAYQDPEVAVVEKPAGMPTQPLSPEETGTLANAALYKWPGLEKVGDNLLEPGMVHRLDTKTHGLVLLAKNREAFDFLKRDLRMRRIKKSYRALVHGQLRKNKGKIDAPLARHPSRPGTMVVADPGVRFRGKPMDALTRFKVLERKDELTLVELELVTGVMHQLRVHLASMGHPVIGDDRYGEKPDLDSPAYALQSYRLSFMHPQTGEIIDVRCRHPLGFDFLEKNTRTTGEETT
ncbi:MAG: RluA family pseudouridine synthase [bacterium]